MYLFNQIKQGVVISLCGLVLQTVAFAHNHVADKQFWNDVLNNREGAVARQLHTGLDPNIKSQEGEPAVMWAIQNQSWDVYDLLIQAPNFDPNITNHNNETPLMYLAILGELPRAQTLYAKGAKINRLGWTPLHYAASKGQVEFAQWLLDEGAFVHAPAPDGTTPLMMAAFSGNKEMVDMLLDAGADLNAVNLNYHTAIDWAQSAKHSNLARYLQALQQAPLESSSAPQKAQHKPEDSTATVGGSSKYFDLQRFE